MTSQTDIEKGDSEKSRSWVIEVLLAGCAITMQCFVAFTICLYMVWVVPRYRQFADSFGAELPGAVVSLFRLSELFLAYWYLFMIAVIVFGGPMALALRFLPNRFRWVRTCWLVSWPLAALVFLLFESLVLSVVVHQLASQLR